MPDRSAVISPAPGRTVLITDAGGSMGYGGVAGNGSKRPWGARCGMTGAENPVHWKLCSAAELLFASGLVMRHYRGHQHALSLQGRRDVAHAAEHAMTAMETEN